MRRRIFLATPLLLPGVALAASRDPPPLVSYPPVTPGIRLSFPRDHGAHPDFRSEWWYVTGALDPPHDDSGFQLTFFRSRPGIAEALQTPIAARQILFAHAALTTPEAGLRHTERAARAGLGAAFASDDCNLEIGTWRMFRQETGDGEQFRLLAPSRHFSFDFTLTPWQALLLQGNDGYSRKGRAAELASYYVSWPQLQVSGTLSHDGRKRTVRGRAWFDHEWSTAILGGGAVGWDWIGINLADGGALMAFRLRDAQAASVFTHAAWRDASGKLRQFADGEVFFSVQRIWLSPRTGARYPVQIEIRFGEHTVRTLPVVDDQELATRQPRPIVYWEGLVQLDGSLRGRGYLEMTGYAGRLQL